MQYSLFRKNFSRSVFWRRKFGFFRIVRSFIDYQLTVLEISYNYGVIWGDNIDIACDELFYNSKIIHTPFDGLIAFSDATQLWGLNESTLRKAIAYRKLMNGIDVCKFWKQWVISKSAMEREYGLPKEST